MSLRISLSTKIRDSFRVQQVVGMFDLPLDRADSVDLDVELPAADVPWTIGAIVGPSGSGKTTVARAAFGIERRAPRWPRDRAVIDAFGQRPIRRLLTLLAAVGLNSPLAWLRPYHLLSTGEKFRCDLARRLSRMENPLSLGEGGLRSKPGEGRPAQRSATSTLSQREREKVPLTPALSRRERAKVLVIDEFTSHLDRDTARSASFALARFLRRLWTGFQPVVDRLETCPTRRGAGVSPARDRLETCPTRFVAVTCHEDILPWLAPDWVLRLPQGTLDCGPFVVPPLPLRFARADRRVWADFRPHHYLSGQLARGATCYVALWSGRPAAFCAVLAQIGHRGRKRITRLVTLPQFQGLGIGLRLAEYVCRCESSRGFRVSIATSHPAVIAACRRSPRWRYLGIKRCGGTPQRIGRRRLRGSTGRIVAAFEYRNE
jgi:GNAT superfamily N-acetyltransferase